MYCYKCGAQIEDSDSFCNYCGTNVVSQATELVNAPATPLSPASPAVPVSPSVPLSIVSPSAPVSPVPSVSPLYFQEASRKDAIAELDRMISYFSQKEKQYENYDHYSERIAFYNNPRSRIVTTGSGKPGIIVGSIMMGLSLPVGEIAALIGSISSDSAAGGITLGIALFAIGGILLGAGIKTNIDNKNYDKKTRASEIRKNTELLNAVTEELALYYENYGYCPTGPSYTNPKILRKLRELVYLGRADSIKEAINIMHQDAHNSEMELQASLAARSAASAARGAKATAFFTAANFFLR